MIFLSNVLEEVISFLLIVDVSSLIMIPKMR